MLRRWLLGCLFGVGLLAGCSTSEKVSVSITPSGTVQVTGPTAFTAQVHNSIDVPTWSLSGPGSLSGTTGNHVVYSPPVPAESGSATLTASAAGASSSVQITLGTATVTAATIPGLSAAVTVAYDAEEVPHVQCAATNDCLAVQGWLHARDRLFQMDFLRRLARGRSAELVGPLTLSEDISLRTMFTTRDGGRLEDALVTAMDADTASKVSSYIGGINAYLAGLRAGSATLPGEYAQLPYPITAADIPDWTPADVTALARLEQFELSESIGEETDYGKFAQTYGQGPLADPAKMNAWMRSPQPVGAKAHTLTSTLANRPASVLPAPAPARPARGKAVETRAAPPTPPLVASAGQALSRLSASMRALERVLKPLDGSVGSNNWVVDGAHSATGKSMVANDPHLSLQYPPNFYLTALTSSNASDHLDIRGGAFPGVPGALVGRGQNVGWGVTVVGYDVTDLYVEEVTACPGGTPPQVPFCVMYDSTPSLVLPVAAQWKVRTGPGDAGLVDAKTLPAAQQPSGGVPSGIAVVPRHGPVVQAPSAGQAISVRWTGHESWTDDLHAFLGLDTAPDLDSALTALEDFSTGAQNFVLADNDGHIAYFPHALVPVRNFANAVLMGGHPIPPWIPIPGNTHVTDWGTGNAADHCDGLDHSSFPPTFVKPADACWIPNKLSTTPPNNLLPYGRDPAKGFFATANSDPLGVSDHNPPFATSSDMTTQAAYYFSFDWGDPTGLRISRITQRLEAATANGGKVSLDDMQSIQGDHVSLLGQIFAGILGNSAFDPAATANADFAAARKMLTDWAGPSGSADCPTGLTGVDPAKSPASTDATVLASSAACYLFHAFLRDLLHNVFADDLAVAGLGVDGGPAVRGILYLLGETSPTDVPNPQTFCNDVATSGANKGATIATHTCPEQAVTALVQAYKTLSASKGATSNWLWGRVHTMQPVSLVPIVTTGYEPGPFARPGGAFTVDVGNPELDGTSPTFSFNSSGNVRHISVMDPSNAVTKMQLPGPQKDLPYGVFEGPDLLLMWVQDQYFDYLSSSQIGGATVSSQDFAP